MALLAFASVQADEEGVGDVLRAALPIAAVGLTYARGDAQGRRDYLQALATTAVVTYVLKETVTKARPDGDDKAFPSGHASVAFSGASFVQRRYGWSLGTPAYVAAAYVGWSRVNADRHDYRDVLAGAAIGAAATYLFVRRRQPPLSVVPVLTGDYLGVRLAGQW